LKNEYSNILEMPVQTIKKPILAIETPKTSSTGNTLRDSEKQRLITGYLINTETFDILLV